jgi:hypothetical protein
MRFQVGNGWVIGAVCIPASVIINLAPDKREEDHTEFEKLARGRLPPPIDSCALDWDCAVTMWRAYDGLRHRLHRHLSSYDQEMFDRIVSGDLQNVL